MTTNHLFSVITFIHIVKFVLFLYYLIIFVSFWNLYFSPVPYPTIYICHYRSHILKRNMIWWSFIWIAYNIKIFLIISGKVFNLAVFKEVYSHSVLHLQFYFGSWARKKNTRDKPGIKSAKPWEKNLKYEQIIIALFLLDVFADKLTPKRLCGHYKSFHIY